MSDPAPRPDPRPDPRDDRAEATVEVDARGKACPMPVIELSQAVEAAPAGTRVRLLATDPAAKVDVPVWCRMQRHELRSATETGGVWTFIVMTSA